MDKEFAHGGNESNFGGFAVLAEALIKGFEDGIVVGSDDGAHVEGVAHESASAMDVALSAEDTTVAVKRSEPGQRGGLSWYEPGREVTHEPGT